MEIPFRRTRVIVLTKLNFIHGWGSGFTAVLRIGRRTAVYRVEYSSFSDQA